jgi:hypothetical protein
MAVATTLRSAILSMMPPNINAVLSDVMLSTAIMLIVILLIVTST